MFSDCLILLVSLLIILGSAEFFTNGIEWLGHRLQLSEGVVGSVLAAVGTALPETLLPIVAVLFFGDRHGHDVGVGAIIGAPFMLTTLTLGVCGGFALLWTRMGKREARLNINLTVISRDLRFFIGSFGLAVLCSFVHQTLFHYGVALALLLAYALYLRKTFAHSGEPGQTPEYLHFDRFLGTDTSRLWLIVLQVAAGLAGIVGGAWLFVDRLQSLAGLLGVSPLILSLIVSPIATELPEKVNSILWSKSGKDTLAIGNITGAMVFQACFPVAFGIAVTSWQLTSQTLVTSCVSLACATFYLLLVNAGKLKSEHLLLGAGAYVITITYVLRTM